MKSIFFNIFGGITRCGKSRAASRGARRTSHSRSSCGSTALTPRRAARCSPTRRRRACTWSRRCSTPPGARWSWREGVGSTEPPGAQAAALPTPERGDERLVVPRRGLPDAPEQREGEDLDLIVRWAAGSETALDVATGSGHVARRLREAGLTVVSADPAPGCVGRALPGRGPAVRRRRLRPRRLQDRAAPLRGRGRRRRRDGARLE